MKQFVFRIHWIFSFIKLYYIWSTLQCLQITWPQNVAVYVLIAHFAAGLLVRNNCKKHEWVRFPSPMLHILCFCMKLYINRSTLSPHSPKTHKIRHLWVSQMQIWRKCLCTMKWRLAAFYCNFLRTQLFAIELCVCLVFNAGRYIQP